MRSSASSSHLQYLLSSLRSSNSCLGLLARLHATSNLLSIFPSIRGPTQNVTKSSQPSFFLLSVGCSSRPWLFVALLHFSLDRSNWSSPSCSSITFQIFPGISHLRSEVSKFQHHTKKYFECSTLLVSSLNLSSICWWKESSSCWKMLSSYISFLVWTVACFEHYRRFD